MRDTTSQRKVRLGMVGGGPGSNIGETHRYAARFDGRYELVTGVFASAAARSLIIWEDERFDNLAWLPLSRGGVGGRSTCLSIKFD